MVITQETETRPTEVASVAYSRCEGCGGMFVAIGPPMAQGAQEQALCLLAEHKYEECVWAGGVDA